MVPETFRKIPPVKTDHGFHHAATRTRQSCQHFERTKRLAFLQMAGTRIKQNDQQGHGQTKNKNKAMIPVIFRLLDTKLFVQLIDLALNNHGSYHGTKKPRSMSNID